MVTRLVHMRVLPERFVTPEKSKNLGTEMVIRFVHMRVLPDRFVTPEKS